VGGCRVAGLLDWGACQGARESKRAHVCAGLSPLLLFAPLPAGTATHSSTPHLSLPLQDGGSSEGLASSGSGSDGDADGGASSSDGGEGSSEEGESQTLLLAQIAPYFLLHCMGSSTGAQHALGHYILYGSLHCLNILARAHTHTRTQHTHTHTHVHAHAGVGRRQTPQKRGREKGPGGPQGAGTRAAKAAQAQQGQKGAKQPAAKRRRGGQVEIEYEEEREGPVRQRH